MSVTKRSGINTEQKKNLKHLVIIILLCLLGLVVSVELFRIHFFTHTDPEFHSLCAVSDGMNCETVALSSYSVFAGLPVCIWGIIGYVVMLAVALWMTFDKKFHPHWLVGTFFLLATFSVLTSVALATISFTRIDSLCLFCMSCYAINISLFILSCLLVRRTQANLFNLVINDILAFGMRPVLLSVITSAVILSIVAGIISIDPYWKIPGWTELPTAQSGTDEDGHHWIGAKDPLINIVEFSDYQCPHCRNAHKKMRLLAAKYPDEVRLIHRHLPLDNKCHPKLKQKFHDHACRFAIAAECAGIQNKFWEMNDALFSIQDKVKASDVEVEKIAIQLGIDRSSFVNCVEKKQTENKVKDDLNAAIKLGLNGTPTFVVGKEKFTGGIPVEIIEQLVRNSAKVVRK